jgi:tRNA threonylcarbamoyladenosine modification (KEOPS) complex Cgi121 subunit
MIHARAYRCGADLGPDEVKREAARANQGSLVQTASEDSAGNESFVEMLAAQTFRAEASGSMLAKKREVDLLLRLAGTTQISKAIREKGAAEGKPFLLVVVGKRIPRQVPGLAGAELPRRPLSRVELQMIERAALLDVQKA